MALVNPIALNKVAFNATNNEIFYFTSNGGDQVVKNRLTVRKQSDNSIVYQATATTFLFQHTLPSGTLTNGTYYNYFFNTYDASDNMSANSNVVAFYCYTTPTITFTNYPSTNIINNSSYEFAITYDQLEDELLNYLTYYLYDANGNEISNSGELRSALTPPLSFAYTFNGFEDSDTYKIQIKAISQNGTITLSELKTFSSSYYYPEMFSLLTVENLCNDGVMRIKSNLASIEGETNYTPTLYFSEIEDEENIDTYIKWGEWYTTDSTGKVSTWAEKYMLDLRGIGTNVLFDGSFSIDSNFEFQLWGTPNRLGELCRLSNSTAGSNPFIITLKRGIPYGETNVKDWIEISDEDGLLYDYSNYVDPLTYEAYVSIWIKKISNTYTITLDVVSRGSTQSISWGSPSSVEWNLLTDFNWSNETYSVLPNKPKIHGDISGMFPFSQMTIQNMNVDNMDTTSDTTRVYSRNFPTWDYYTKINCNFNGNLNGGNISMLLSTLEGIKVKRRLSGTFEWITLYFSQATDVGSLSFIYDDKYCPNGLYFDYAVVPVLTGSIEGDYIINANNKSSFDGCFICDKDSIFKLYNACSYPTITNSLTAGILTPIGRRYPILVYNTENNFESGTFSGNLLGYDFEDTRRIDRADVQEQTNDYKTFIHNRKPKILKDWNGKIQLIGVTGAIVETPDLISGKTNVSFAWAEQGQYNDQSDLYDNGLIEVEE